MGGGGGAIGLSFQLKEIVIHNAAGFIRCLQHPDKAIDLSFQQRNKAENNVFSNFSEAGRRFE